MHSGNTQIIRCPSCGAANRVPATAAGKNAKCGKCHKPLLSGPEIREEEKPYTLRCGSCNAKNRVPATKINDTPKCGKCGEQLNTGALFVPQPMMINDANFEERVLKSPLPVLVFAWAPWCPTCIKTAPVIDEFAAQVKTRIRVGKLNVDQNKMLASRYRILSVPFLFIFDNGQLKESMPGGLDKHALMMQMGRYI